MMDTTTPYKVHDDVNPATEKYLHLEVQVHILTLDDVLSLFRIRLGLCLLRCKCGIEFLDPLICLHFGHQCSHFGYSFQQNIAIDKVHTTRSHEGDSIIQLDISHSHGITDDKPVLVSA